MTEDDHADRNRDRWDSIADDWMARGEAAWVEEPHWGEWRIPESDLNLLPSDMAGRDAIEIGCGTGYVSAWMERRGARVRAIDISENQLETALRLQSEHGTDIEFVCGDAEHLPWDDESADYAISEYGASIWCEPSAWLREAHRVLRPGGSLVFLGSHPLCNICEPLNGDLPVVETLQASYFDLHHQDWGEEGVCYNLPLSRWFEVFRDIGFVVEDYREPRPTSASPERCEQATREWAVKWPTEQVFKLRKP
ncbi:MAG: class I SAM-dependent methyltransferase [Demequinaceae bacterium]|nr:class I SAM-dependent methyltransferase [Demequinaceae bacterium]